MTLIHWQPLNALRQQVKRLSNEFMHRDRLAAANAELSETPEDLTLTEKVREAIVLQRQDEAHLQETMHGRIASAMQTDSGATDIQAATRELIVEQRQLDGHWQETMHERIASEIGAPEAD